MERNLKAVLSIDTERAKVNREMQEYLLELADRCAKGEILDLAIVYNDKIDRGYTSYGNFEDRWRLIGAFEYAKSMVTDNGA